MQGDYRIFAVYSAVNQIQNLTIYMFLTSRQTYKKEGKEGWLLEVRQKTMFRL